MFWPFKKKCDHDWRFVSNEDVLEYWDNGCNVDCEKVRYVNIYCPKCNTTSRKTPTSWENIQIIQKIREDYKKEMN